MILPTCEVGSFQKKQKTVLKIHFALNDGIFLLYSLLSLKFQTKVKRF